MKFRFSIQRLAQVAIASLGFAGVVHSAAADETAALTPAPAYSLNFKQTEKLIGLAVAAANARHLAMSFAVVDPGGHLIAAARMDGAPFASLDFARGKAFIYSFIINQIQM